MKTFATKQRSAANGVKSAVPGHAPTHHGPVHEPSAAQRVRIHEILHGPRIQPKLAVGPADDAFEREADRVADQVMRMPDPTLQRTCACGGTCADCRDEHAETELLQRKSNGPRTADPAVAPPIVHEVLKSPGQPLDPETRAFMEPRFGRDFSNVRIHAEAKAQESARAVNATAYTVGSDIVWGAHAPSPGTSLGKRLVAHELTHVVEQTGGVNRESALRRAPTDFHITEIAPDDAATPNMIFFEAGDSAIPATESHKITALASPATRDLTLNGFSSEEGSIAENDALIIARLGSVDAALAAAGHTGVRVRANLRASGEGQINYRHMRSVEIMPTPVGMASAPSAQPACGSPGAEVEPCATAFSGSWPDANRAMAKAVAELGPPASAAAAPLLATLFGGVAEATVRTNIASLAAQVAALPGQHRCHNSCDSACGRPAYNSGSGIGVGGANMTLCPDFLGSSDTDWQARILIHEAAHGTAGLIAEDIAYANSRQISFLLPADQVRNTDSYVALAWLLFKPGTLTIGPSSPDVVTGMSAPEELATRRAVAWLETWLNYGDFDTEVLYDAVVRLVPSARRWGPGDEFERETMRLIAPLFGLTDPGPTAPFVEPTNADKTKIAAIHDRYDQMYRSVVWNTLTIRKGAVGSQSWGSHGASLPRLDQTATVEPTFFALSAVDQVKNLVVLMATAMYGISPGYRSKYAEALDRIRNHRSMGP